VPPEAVSRDPVEGGAIGNFDVPAVPEFNHSAPG
jgi:hypothetical protein